MQSDSTEMVIARVRAALETVQASELERLYVRLPTLPGRSREEILQFSNRLMEQFLDQPLKSLCDEASTNSPHQLLEAFQQLFQIDRSVGTGPRATCVSTVAN
jgi:glutamyl-tRNA reductase